MKAKFCLIFLAVFVCVGSIEGAEDAILINLLEGQRLEIVCPKYYENSMGFDPLLKYRNTTSRVDEQIQLAFGSNRRYDAPPNLKIAVSEDEEIYTYYIESVEPANAGEYSCDQKDMSDYLVSVFTRSSLRCPDISSMMPLAELEPLSASCNVTKTGPEGVQWPRGFFVMQKRAGDEVITIDVEDREGQLSIHNSQAHALYFTRDDHLDGNRLSCTIPSLDLHCHSDPVNVTWSPEPPEFVDTPPFLRKGDSARIRCAVDDLGNPPVKLAVEDLAHPEAVVDVDIDGHQILFTYQSANLSEIANASLRCFAGSLTEDVSFVVAQGPDSVRPDKEEISVDSGQTFSISCEAVASNPAALITYFINDEKIFDPEMIVARPEMNGGSISCLARNPLSRVESPTAQVPIKVRFLARTTTTDENVVVHYKTGDDVSLACPYHGNPAPRVIWTYAPSTNVADANSSSAENEIVANSSFDGGRAVYTIANASAGHAGVYACAASNDIGSETSKIQLGLLEDEDESQDIFPSANKVPVMTIVVPLVVVAIVVIAALVALILRRKAVAGKLDVEKGNAQIRAAPEREEDATLLPSNQLAVPMPIEIVLVDEDEDASFIATETEPVTVEDGDLSKEEIQDQSLDSHPPSQHEFQPGDEKL